jgi:hypothetical protein
MAAPGIVPIAHLIAMTPEARDALGGRPGVRIDAFPFRIGRENRSPRFQFLPAAVERRISGTPPVNDLYLVEPISVELHISREHLVILYAHGLYAVVDRDSACGTSVAGVRLGADRPARRAELHDDDVIVLGQPQSPYAFRFQVDH